jgi:Flp pilus assembly protein TadD
MALHYCQPPQHGEAIRFLTAAAALRPDTPGVRLNLGNALVGAGRLDEAIVAYRQAIGLKPDYSMAHLRLSMVLDQQGHLEDAISACLRATQFKPDYGTAYSELGIMLVRAGRLDEGLAACRKAISLVPDSAESHCNLGIALWKQGEFAQALIALEHGHELGSRREDWRYPSAQWVRACRRRIELDARLPAFLRGEAQPADANECVEYAQICYEKRRYVASARFFVQALSADPKPVGDPERDPRFQAACAAALAGYGRGSDADQLDAKELVRWREQALQWLQVELQAYGERLPASNPRERGSIQEQLRLWQSEPALASLRDTASVARLPADEQESCKQIWAEVKELLAKAAAAEPAESHSPVP